MAELWVVNWFLIMERFSLQIKNNVLKLKKMNVGVGNGHNVLTMERYSLNMEKKIPKVKKR